ncbi:MAG TPA: GNAT family N-acetyltransferase [Anaerolineales bacterium]|nr:GNAT family N-acetyltransferase [Anaerolineales bacterium]HLF02475.1 GNAT family N-acetyltransferase [Anaerolineales bacterium]
MLQLYPSLPTERADIERVTHAAGNFKGDELTTPLELFDGYMRGAKASGYNFISAKREDQVVGYACFGPTPLTEATYDLYWIVAEASAHGQGVGRALFDHVVSEIKNRGGRLLMIWTSSTPNYERARSFYLRMGCKLETQIKEFYRADDDLCIYSYRIG